MLINPIVLFISLLIIFVSFIVSAAKKPRFPVLTVTGICISTIYLFFAYVIDGAMFSVTEFTVPESIVKISLSILINSDDLSHTVLEDAFLQFAIAQTGMIIFTVVSVIYDVKRIFFGKMYI